MDDEVFWAEAVPANSKADIAATASRHDFSLLLRFVIQAARMARHE